MLVFKESTAGTFPKIRSDAVFRRLDRSELVSALGVPKDVMKRQANRLKRFGEDCCYGAFVGGALAAFAWLVPHEKMHNDVPHILIGEAGEAEMTGAETLPRYRGKSLYGFVIDNCIAAAGELGIDAVYFKTYPSNVAARRVFEKNRYKFVGVSYILKIPGVEKPFVWPRRFQ
jgi:ribosomal protein S18 acetylase RimI-like enzyme